MNNNSFPVSVYVTGIVCLMVFINLKDETAFVLLFAITQLFAGFAAVFFLLLRLFRIIKSSGSFIYPLTGSIQLALLITDFLLLFDHNLIRRNMLVFAGLNALFGICILKDDNKRNKKKINEYRV